MPDSEQKIHKAVLPSSAPSPNSPWDDAAESAAPTADSSPDFSSETEWDGDVNQLFSNGSEPSAPGDSDPASASVTATYSVHPPSEYSPVSPSQPSHLDREINQTLARLELNSLEVKLYLDSIEEKISRMEPRLDQLQEAQPLAEPVAEPPTDPSQADPSPVPSTPAPQVATPAESTTERRRRRLDLPVDGLPDSVENRGLSPRSPSTFIHPLSDEDPWAFLPWLLARRRQLAVVAAVLVAFVTILAFSARPRPQSPAATAVPPTTLAPAPMSSSSPAKSSAAIPANADPILAPDSSQAAPAASNVPASTPSAASPQVAASASPLIPSPATSSAGSAAPASVPPSKVASSDTPVGSKVPQAIPASGRIQVSSGVMAGNLVFSPSPRYPGGLASLFHTEGEVTLQAIISRNGRVEDLRVLSGHRLLRGAAQDAVRTWRYRPYLINGVPVEVATIITVEFHR